MLLRIIQLIPVIADYIIQNETDLHHLGPLHKMTVGGHNARERMDQMRRHLQHEFSFPDGFSHALDIQLLKVTEAAMDNFQAVG